MQNIFIENGVLIIGGNGKLACIEDILEHTAMTGEIFQGVIQLRDSVWSWFDNTEDKESIEDVGEICEYIPHKEIKTLYTELIEDTNGLEEIMSMCSDENDVCLRVISRHICSNTVYVHNYSRLADGEIDKITAIAHVEMFKNLFKRD
ncbi:hypothetical protein LGL55_10445 [Clostridium tagluense]|uniref:hypothetical protein n=1 Tax=Clostridium tagluense TaxID=360422 RepID=UPI001CF1950A|nr:hypothetical protein [Clostridium tagluense]MCB2311642.1 hypothetical protein [Clostridium tagluense]MCB2316366.1 hypothetical protein [Clostridium tagluense]MCB2321250.1 hypothetical protein [Clostridium tagluense]MCB2326235.1 hypothetical protein [Clostridium tagluense]MCB2330986.1 hypothetical protein [Clostridium tagluense]